MRKLLAVSLKVKILTLIILLIVFIVISLSSMFILMKRKDDIAKAEQLSLQTVKTLSYMPVLHDYFRSGQKTLNLGMLIEQIQREPEPITVFFQNRNGATFASTDGLQVYKDIKAKDNDKALTFGSSYVLKTTEDRKEVLKAVAPIVVSYGKYKKIEGAVVVLYDVDTLYASIWEDIKKIFTASIIILLIGVIASYLLTKSIRKDTLNLEPSEIAALFRERGAILQSVKEGILAVDEEGSITMMNSSAHDLLDIDDHSEGKQVSDVIQSSEMLELLGSNEKQTNVEIQYQEKMMIINTQPIIEDGKKIGTVASFRDRTEFKHMIEALSEVKEYSDDLRAQSHEFTNKLYAILGLLQLDKKEKAIEFIKSETHIQTVEEDLLFTKINDERLQAILLGKIAQASEKKIDFVIDKESSLAYLPEEINLSSLIIILGNLINNAFDAVKHTKEKKVSFFVTDIGNEIIFEVQDSGTGIQKEMEHQLFQKGLSSKGKNRGYGLFNVEIEVGSLGGAIEYSSGSGEGTVFTVYLPKAS
ncbi:sensor histidine kinase [Fictibacillus enclensis]|uniref:sensor histidine kinase n=1 Tax=Fictibacillus enclensis TaxID=1017270 RepID=UPI0024BFCF75|nr:sensor histidine kinase [Fictibacillus enclensis]WHY72369.1 sensor histidine kinase [Fictibacillus enclensis]